ncbi:MAG: gamma-glutamyl-gamma-aminobutyrate hydrolase family protein [Acidobacteria bacterium]|nr:gamma-glutamyl-gamma-aminobutyrate hydrolase family protein [Acidobacteriota bacterium]MBU4307957.1 gamma-glutamyl-gamma-aminobutyrate hydrolase family protein [Acidobacteriota bacterium]MCG2811494.1 gamma-glutamyl-gamma-aminobutyrate hydrolase family protein [Candidatus Aminicenantes bacterium]
MKKVIRSIFFLLFLSNALAAVEAQGLPPGVPVIVMTHPTLFQVKNIVEMYEKDIIPLPTLVLLGIFHEDELANPEEAKAYKDAAAYVKENGISWVRFRTISGRVKIDDLFDENLWSGQFREIFATASGILFTGGMDIPPALYNQGISLLSEPTTPARSFYEISFLFHLLGGSKNPAFTPFLAGRRDFPLLAICLGAQSLNVAAGGSLIQDIPSEVYGQKTVEEVLAAAPDRIHSGVYLAKLFPNDSELMMTFHRIRLGEDSVFVRKMGFSSGDRPFVATAHHQAIAELGANLHVTATSLDGKIVEAVEHRLFANVLGIQFHPERHTLYRKGFFQREKTGAPLNFNPLDFLQTHPPALAFHQAIWKWFAEAVSAKKL